MQICRVVGSVVSTLKIRALTTEKLLIVQPLDLEGRDTWRDLIAVDDVDAGVGDKVLVLFEGRSARDIRNKEYFPVRAVIVGVVDDLQLQTADS